MADEASVDILTEPSFSENVRASHADNWVERIKTFNTNLIGFKSNDEILRSAMAPLINEVNSAVQTLSHELTSSTITARPEQTRRVVNDLFAGKKLVSPGSPFGQEISKLQQSGQPEAANSAYVAFLRDLYFPLPLGPGNRAVLKPQFINGLIIASLYKYGGLIKWRNVEEKVNSSFRELSERISTFKSEQKLDLEKELSLLRSKVSATLTNIDSKTSEQQKKIDDQVQLSQALNEAARNFTNWKSEVESKLNKSVETTETELKRLENTFRTELVLDETYKFWEKRASENKITAKVAGKFLIGFATAIFVVIGGVLYQFLGTLNKPVYETPALLMLGIFAFSLAAIWGGRILTRNYMQKRYLVEDAEERATLIKTYIALIKEGGITPAEADVVLRALFRPAANSLNSDAEPTMPHELLTTIVSKHTK